MNDHFFDLQAARTLISKAQRVSFGVADNAKANYPFIQLGFHPGDRPRVQAVLQQLSRELTNEQLKLFINENGGDFLTVSFLWHTRGVLFTSLPDRYDLRECRQFRQAVFYGEVVKLFFSVETDGKETVITAERDKTEINSLSCTYHHYIS